MVYGDVFQKRSSRFSFLSNLNETFQAQKSKIKLEEQYDFQHINNPSKRINNLKKNFYNIPDIELSEDSDSSSSEGDSSSDEYGGQSGGTSEEEHSSQEKITIESIKPKKVKQRKSKSRTKSRTKSKKQIQKQQQISVDDTDSDDEQNKKNEGHGRDGIREFVPTQGMIEAEKKKRERLELTKARIKLAKIPKYQRKGLEQDSNKTQQENQNNSESDSDSKSDQADKKSFYEDMTWYKKQEEKKQLKLEKEKQKRLEEATKRFNQQAENPVVKKPGEITPDLLPREVMDLEEGKVIPQSQFISPNMAEASVDSVEVRKMKMRESMRRNISSMYKHLRKANGQEVQSQNVDVKEPQQVQTKEVQQSPDQKSQNQPKEVKRIIDNRKSILKLTNKPQGRTNEDKQVQMEDQVQDAVQQSDDEEEAIDKQKDKRKKDKDNNKDKGRDKKEKKKMMKNSNRGNIKSQHMEIHKEVAMTKISMKLEEQFALTNQNKQVKDQNSNVQDNLQVGNQALSGGQLASQTSQVTKQQEQINELKMQITQMIKKNNNEIKEVKERQNKDKDSWLQKITFIEKNIKLINQKILNDIKTTNQKSQEEMIKKINEVQNDLLEKNEQLLSESSENQATVYKQVVQLRSDFKLEVEKAKQQLGIGHSQLSSNIDLYSLSRVIDLILQYLLVHRFFDEDYVNFDISMNDFVNNQKEDKLADIQLGNANSQDKLAQRYDSYEENRKKNNSATRIITEITEQTHVNKSNCEQQSDDGQNDILNNKTAVFQVTNNNINRENSQTTVINFELAEDSLSCEKQNTQTAYDQAQSFQVSRQTMSSPTMFNEDIEIRARQVSQENVTNNQTRGILKRIPAEHPIEQRSVGEINFMKERQSLRAHKVIEQAWLIFQFMKNNKKRISFEDQDLTPNRLQALLNGLKSDRFRAVNRIMDQSKISRLLNDEDSTLTANSLLNYTMLIKQKQPSVEGKLVEGYINRKLWEDLHSRKNNYYDIPISQPTQKELITNIHTKNDIPMQLNDQVKQNNDIKSKQLQKLKKAMNNIDQMQNSLSQNEIQSIISSRLDDSKQVSMNQQNYKSFFQSRQKMQQRCKQRSVTTTNQTMIDNELFLEPETVGLSIMSDQKFTNASGQVTNVQTSHRPNESQRMQAFSQRDFNMPTNNILPMDQQQVQAQRRILKSPMSSHKGGIKDLTKIYNKNSFNFDVLTSHRNSTPSHHFYAMNSRNYENRRPSRTNNQSPQLTDYLGGLQKSKSRRSNMESAMQKKNMGNSTQVTKIPMSIVQAHIASGDHNLSPNRSVLTPTGQLFSNQSVNYIDDLKKRVECHMGGGVSSAILQESNQAVSTKNQKQTAQQMANRGAMSQTMK